MQVTSVERWTFWGAFAVVFLGLTLGGTGLSPYPSGDTTGNIAFIVLTAGFALLAISVGFGNSSDPSVWRRASPGDP